MNVLIFNAGSSSLKFSFVEALRERTLAEGAVDWAAVPARLTLRREGRAPAHTELPVQTHAAAVVNVLHELLCGPSAPPHGRDHVHAVGHRVVHGGERYTSLVRITPEIWRNVLALAGAHVKKKLRNVQIECQAYAYEHGVDKPEMDQWTWPH